MARPEFRFELQPKLTHSAALKERAQAELARLREEVERQEEEVGRVRAKLEGTLQRAAAEREKMLASEGSAAGGPAWADRARYLERLRERAARERGDVERSTADLAELERRCDGARQRLAALGAEVEALERLKQTRLGEHRKALEQHEQDQVEDMSIQRWKSEPRS